MNKKQLISKVILLITVISGFLWLGGTIFRGVIAYRLFESFSLIIRSELTAQAIEQTLLIIGGVNVYILSSYLIFIASFLIYLLISDLKMKENGWLFMLTFVIIFFIPVEGYLFYIDLKYTLLVYTENFSLNQGLSLLIQRISALSGLPVIALLSYFAAVFFVIFQPLKIKQL